MGVVKEFEDVDSMARDLLGRFDRAKRLNGWRSGRREREIVAWEGCPMRNELKASVGLKKSLYTSIRTVLVDGPESPQLTRL